MRRSTEARSKRAVRAPAGINSSCARSASGRAGSRSARRCRTPSPSYPGSELQRGDIVTLVGRTPEITAATKMLGYPDRATDVADIAFIGAAVALGAILGTLVYNIGSVPLTLGTSGGALISGLFFGWLR